MQIVGYLYDFKARVGHPFGVLKCSRWAPFWGAKVFVRARVFLRDVVAWLSIILALLNGSCFYCCRFNIIRHVVVMCLLACSLDVKKSKQGQ